MTKQASILDTCNPSGECICIFVAVIVALIGLTTVIYQQLGV